MAVISLLGGLAGDGGTGGLAGDGGSGGRVEGGFEFNCARVPQATQRKLAASIPQMKEIGTQGKSDSLSLDGDVAAVTAGSGKRGAGSCETTKITRSEIDMLFPLQ